MKVVPPIHRFHVRSFDFEAWWNPQSGSKGSTGIADKRRCGSGPHRHVSLCWPAKAAKGNLQKIKASNTSWVPIWRSEGLGVWEAREKDPAGMTWLWHAPSVLLWRWANTSSCTAALRSRMQFKMQLPSKNLLRQKRLAVSVYEILQVISDLFHTEKIKGPGQAMKRSNWRPSTLPIESHAQQIR